MNKAILKYKLLVVLLMSFALNASSQSFTTKLFTTADGLSDNYIYCIYQDSYGYLWIGTRNGLNRFDGKRFVHYGLKNGLPSLHVDAIYEDRHHRLWIGTRGGMAELKGDSCYTYPVNDKKEIYFVSSFFEKENGRLWVTTHSGVYEFSNNTWVKISLYPGKENSAVSKIITTKSGLYINYENTSVIRQKPDGTYEVILSVKLNRPYYNSLFAKDDTVYINTYSGLQYWNGNKWIKRFEDTLGKKISYTSYRDKSNRFWFGTKEDGALAIIPSGNRINYLHIPLSANLVSGFFEDREKNIWIAGFRGLVKVSVSPYQIISFPGFEKVRSVIRAIAMPSGKVAVSYGGGKLLILKPSTGNEAAAEIVTTFQFKDPEDFIFYYTFDEKQRMWFTTREGKLYRLENETLTDFTSIIACKNTSLQGIAYNKKTKQLFVCGDSVMLAGNENRLDTFFSAGKKQFIPIPYLVTIREADGSMLIQTIENGLFLVSNKGEISLLDKNPDIFISAYTPADDDKQGTLWAAHQGKDISKFSWKNAEPPELKETINEKDGLPDYTILSIALDKEEKLWIATTKGITLMQKDQRLQWVHRDYEIIEDGTAIPLSFTKFSEDEEGNMWVNLPDKVVVFNKEITRIEPTQTKTVIEKVLLYNRPTDWAQLTDSLDSYRRLPVDPVLKHDQNTLSIFFNGLLLNNSSLQEYSYRLLPADTSWSTPTVSNNVTFYQLVPRNYRFEVRSHIKGFDWSEPAIFSFQIKKPFWETWWFRLLIIMTASALIIFIFRYRIKQLKTKTEMQNQIREMEMKALKAQMNPHFIHNALNSIQSLIINNKSNDASRYISKFANLLRQVLENADKNLISLDKELYSLQLYVDLEMLRLNMEIAYSEHVDENIITSGIKIPPLILQPFVENALWHGLSNKQGDKKITVSIREEINWIICEITDNGIGRKKAAEAGKPFPEGSFSKAVNITTKRLSDFNQSPGIASVSFIDLMENHEPAGTTVIVRIRARYSN